MNRLSLTVQVKFDTAHRLAEHDGKCRNLHGHTYRLEVTVSRMSDRHVNDEDMVTDFGVIKGMINENVTDVYDHAYVVGDANDRVAQSCIESGMKVVELSTPWHSKQTTAEAMVVDISGRLFPPFISAGLRLESLRLWETDRCSAELTFR